MLTYEIATGFALALTIACLPTLCARAEEPIRALWTTDLKAYLESAASTADIDGDGLDEILVAALEEIIAVDGRGTVLWRTHGEGRFMTYPSVLFREGDSALIYAADCAGWLHCLDAKGQQVWRAQLAGAAEWCAAAVCDLDADGVPEVVQTDIKGNVWAFHALSGQMLWQVAVKGIPVSPCVADLNGDGGLEIVAATGDGMLYCIDSKGRILWERKIGAPSPSWATGAPVAFSASDGSVRIAAPAGEGRVLCLDQDGNVLWNRMVRGPVASSISAGDIDEDGVADIFAITQLGVVYRFTETGDALWDIDMQGRTLAAGAIIDIDGDGDLDFVLCTQQGLLLALDEKGEFFYEHQFDTRTINVTPTFGKLTRNSSGLEMVITGGESGLLFCFASRAPVQGNAQWAAYRADPQKTGAWLGLSRVSNVTMRPVDLAWDKILTGEPLRFVIESPEKPAAPLTATAVVQHPDGLRQKAFTKVLGARGELHVPVQVAAPGTYVFRWRVESGDGQVLHENSRTVGLRPFANEIGLTRRAIDTLDAVARDVAPVLPLSASALRAEAVSIEESVNKLAEIEESWSANRTGRDEAFCTTASVVHRAQRAIKAAAAVQRATTYGADTGLLISEGLLWENRGLGERIPENGGTHIELRRRVVPGEYDPVSLNLFNITNRELLVRVRVETASEQPAVQVHRSVYVPTSLGEISWDPLPELDDTRSITVPPLETREIWLNCNFSNTAPGELGVKVICEVLNGAGVLEAPASPQTVPPPIVSAEIVFHVLPFEMAPYGSMRLCTWARPDAACAEDLIAHGNNVFVVGLPQPEYTEAGAWAGLDTQALDDVIHLFEGHDVFLLLSGIPKLHHGFASTEYTKELEVYIPALVAHLESKGVDIHHFALYPADEPGGHGWDAVNRVVQFGEMVDAIRPDILLYVNGGGEAPMFEAMARSTDIWCPSIYMLPDDTPEMRIMWNTNKTMWSYNCAYGFARPIGANVKNINIVGEFRTAALFALRYGATGIGYWSYHHGEDMWTRVQDEYPLVYRGPNGPITSRRWEAVREGIEDYRILAALRDRLKTDTTLDDAARNRIQHILNVRLPDLIDRGFQEMKLGLARYVLDLTHNDDRMRAFREALMDAVAACCP